MTPGKQVAGVAAAAALVLAAAITAAAVMTSPGGPAPCPAITASTG
jgi:hypothetical protein